MSPSTASEVIPQDCSHAKSFQHGTSCGLDAHATSAASGLAPKPTGSPEPKVSDIKKLESGEFIHYVRRNGEIYDWDDESFRKVCGDCSFAHVWKEMVEYYLQRKWSVRVY